MSNRLNYCFRQKVTESELDLGFAYAEQADRALATDLGIANVTIGMAVAQQTVANLTVKVSGPGAAYDSQGRRIPIATDQTVICSVDYNNVATTVAVPGNEKWLSIFAYFDRTLSDPRIDGNSATVYFEEAETARFKVVQGSEAIIATAVKPSLIADHVLLADVHLINGQTQIFNSDISAARRQLFFNLAGTPYSIAQGQFSAALGEMLGHLNTHITSGTPGTHLAASITYAGGGTWADGTTNPTTNLEAFIDSIITNLATGDGAGKIAYNGGPAWADSVANPATTVGAQLDKFLTDLVSVSGNAGVGKLGSNAMSSGAYALSGVTLRANLIELLAHLQARNALRTITGNVTIDDAGRDVTLLVSTATGAHSIGTSNPATFGSGRRVYIVDKEGLAPSNNISLVPYGTAKINGLNATKILSAAWGNWTLTSDGTDFYIG